MKIRLVFFSFCVQDYGITQKAKAQYDDLLYNRPSILIGWEAVQFFFFRVQQRRDFQLCVSLCLTGVLISYSHRHCISTRQDCARGGGSSHVINTAEPTVGDVEVCGLLCSSCWKTWLAAAAKSRLGQSRIGLKLPTEVSNRRNKGELCVEKWKMLRFPPQHRQV